jgi:hypothetical protein
VKALFFIGLVVLCLGLLSFVVPIPHTEREGLTVGGVSPGVEANGPEKVSTTVTMAMILGGLGAMVAVKGKWS